MKHVVSVSLGSSSRDHRVEIELLGEKVLVERIGTDGDMPEAIRLIKELDGKVAAFGLGGIDLYIHAGTKRYALRDGVRIAGAAKISPIVDGSGLKNTLERKVISYLQGLGMNFRDVPVLMVCGVDRFGMAEALTASGARLTCGDLIFALGIPWPLRSLRALNRVARIIAPAVRLLPFKYLYPTGEKQNNSAGPKHNKYYAEAQVVAGDLHFIKKYMPERLDGKIIITNTVTREDADFLRAKGVKTLVTTTPELNGRSFGTNVMEALLVALAGKKGSLTPGEYDRLLDLIDFKPNIKNF